jgi:hypothetical protein
LLRQKPSIPLIDLGAIRETLTYIRDDLQRAPGLDRAAERLTQALAEIAEAEQRRLGPVSRSLIDARLAFRRKH